MKHLAALSSTFLLVFLVLGAPVAEAQQTGTVSGRVVTEGGQAMAGAQVSLPALEMGAVTNATGRYLILNVPTGEHTLRVESLGYGTGETTVTVRAGETTTQNFSLGREAVALEEMRVTVGSRAAHTAADELAVPVDVYPEARLQTVSDRDFMHMVNQIAPSIWVPQEQISDIASSSRPFQMRGMSPDQSLVLINGIRRHKMASLMVFGNSRGGSSGADLNTIPQMAIGQMEVLRDGAAAQYGSDAISGVINLQLKNTANPLRVVSSVGKYFPEDFDSDGLRTRVGANWGFEVPGVGGILNVTGEYHKRNLTSRAGHSPRDQVVEGDGDEVAGSPQKVVRKNNPVPQPTFFIADGPSENRMIWANYERDIGDFEDHQLYGFATWSQRNDLTNCFRRRGLEDRNWPQIYPMGFMPKFDQSNRDIQVSPGIRGEFGEWSYDLAGSFAQNQIKIHMTETLNVSLGPSLNEALAPNVDIPNKQKFFAGTLRNTEVLGELVASRELAVGAPSPLNLTLGTQWRSENYEIGEGELGSYVDGGHVNRSGGVGATGAQCFSGWRPGDRVSDWRANFGAFAEGEVDVAPQLRLNAALRFETYDDFGETLTGKIAVRYQPHERAIFRASTSTGFRAPTVAQKNWTHVSTGFQTTADGEQVAVEIGEFPATSPEAQALGATPLQEETSLSFAGGLAWTPVDNLNLTADGYFTQVDDAIILSQTITGDLVEEVLREFQATRIKFMTNAIDLEHYGVDLTANYRVMLAPEALLEFDGALNLQRTEVTSAVRAPDQLREIGAEFFSPFGIDGIEQNRPAERARAQVSLRWADFQGWVATNFFGETGDLINVDPDEFQRWPSKATLDAEVSWQFDNGLQVAFGGENLLDTMPTASPEGFDFFGIFWPGSPFPWVNGRYLYTSMRYTFD